LNACVNGYDAQQRIRSDMDWQPIETAPKDGSDVLLCTDKGVHVIGKRNKHLHIWVERDGRETPRTITHWMPLPPPPNQGNWNIKVTVRGVIHD